MAITELPSSPSGEISHNDVRLKTNELVAAVNLGSTGSDVVLVKSEADFPPAVGGAITLLDGVTYRIEGVVQTDKRFVMGAGCVLSGETSISSTLVFTGTGTMITSVDNNVYINNLGLVCANPTATFISVTGTKLCTFRNFYISCDGDFGQINTSNDCIFSTGYMVFSGTGLTLTTGNDFNYFEVNDCRIEQSSANPCIDLGSSVSEDIVISQNQFLPNGNGVSISGLSGSGNINKTGVVRDCDFKLAFGQTWLNGIDYKDEKWRFRANEGQGVSKSIFLGSALLVNNASSTATIAGVATAIGGIFTSGSQDQRSSVAAVTGQITNLAGVSLRPTLEASGSITNNSGSPETFLFQFFANGVLIPNIQYETTIDAGGNRGFSLIGDAFIDINQVVDIKVTTANGGTFTIPDMQFKVRDTL